MRNELEDTRHYTLALRPGTLLDGGYRITRVLARTSTFAVTYLAQDERAGDQVVLKEFLPRTLAGRAPDELTLQPHSADDAATLVRALRRFTREAELLTDIAHPNLPRVRRCFEANGTAYLVLQHYDGTTLAEQVATSGGRMPPDRATALTLQVLQGLEALHAEGVIHGYITPENLLVDANSRVLVLGLGTTRHIVGPGREPAAGYAPIEQYAAKELGPWTDVYACAAVLYRLATGVTPPSAVERSAGQMIVPPETAEPAMPPALARTVTAGLAQFPDGRPHSAAEFRRRLDASLALGAQRAAARVEERGANPRWLVGEAAEPALAAPAPGFRAQAESRLESSFDDDVVFVNPVDGAGDRVRRLVRTLLGVGGAAAGILLILSLIAGKDDDAWAGGAIAVPPPAAAMAPRTPPPSVSTPRPAAESPARRASESRARPNGATPQPVFKPAAADIPRSTPRSEHAPARSRQSPGRGGDAGRVASSAHEGLPAASGATPAAVALSVPTTIGQMQLLPAELLAGLRERVAHGNENLENGEYARARQIYRTALEQIANVSGRYAGAATLAGIKEDLERATERARVACAAENEMIRKRNGKAVPCE